MINGQINRSWNETDRRVYHERQPWFVVRNGTTHLFHKRCVGAWLRVAAKSCQR